MNLDDRIAEFHSAMKEEFARARSEGIADLVRAVSRVRAASSEREQAAVLQEFASEPAALAFLKTIAPPAGFKGKKNCGRSDSPACGWRKFSSITPRR